MTTGSSGGGSIGDPAAAASPSRQDTRRLLDNVVALGILQAANFLLPLATLPYLARVLGPGHYGLVAFAQSTIQYLVVLTDFGFTISATRTISVHRHDLERVSRVFAAVMALKTILALLGASVLAVVVLLVPSFQDEWRLLAAAYGLVVGNVLFPVWFFQGMERMRFVAALTVLAKAIFTALVFTLVTSEADYVLVPLLTSTGSVVAGLLSLWFVARGFGVRPRWPGATDVREAFTESLGYFGSRVSVALYTSSNTFFLGLAGSPVAVGVYASAEKVYGAMQGVYSPVTNALLPYMSRTRDRALFLKVIAVASAGNALACGALIAFAEPLVRLAFGDSFAAAAPVLRLLATAMVLVLPTFLLGFPFLAAFGYPGYANGSAVAGSLIHLAGLGLLLAVHRLDPVSVATLVVITEATVLGIRMYAVRKTGIWRAG